MLLFYHGNAHLYYFYLGWIFQQPMLSALQNRIFSFYFGVKSFFVFRSTLVLPGLPDKAKSSLHFNLKNLKSGYRNDP
ncbi:hypothetical protein HY02_00935 [Peptococcaceae bacterium SCADC1_2_3]|nr:hypothetical protein HY02_00935 [Peptococcaceae bacterium SCADC1_2_3]